MKKPIKLLLSNNERLTKAKGQLLRNNQVSATARRRNTNPSQINQLKPEYDSKENINETPIFAILTNMVVTQI